MGSSFLHLLYISRGYGSPKFIYEGQWVKVKVTVAKRLQMLVTAVINFDWQFLSVLARCHHRPHIMDGRALEGKLIILYIVLIKSKCCMHL